MNRIKPTADHPPLDAPRNREEANAVVRLLAEHTGARASERDWQRALAKLRRRFPRTVGECAAFEGYLRRRWDRETELCNEPV